MALVLGLFLFRFIPWLGGVLLLIGGVLLVQVIGSLGAIVLVVLIFCVIVLIVLATKAFSPRAKAETAIRSEPLVPTYPPGISIDPGETFYYQSKADWSEFHNERTYSGGYGGVSFRVARGLSLRSGSSRGRSHTNTVLQKTPGIVYLSNARIVFIGGAFSREIRLRSVLHFGNGRSFVRIDLANKPSVQIDVSGPGFGITLDKILSLDTTPQSSRAQTMVSAVDRTAPVALPPVDVRTKRANVEALIAGLDTILPELRHAYDDAAKGQPTPIGPLQTLRDSISWMGAKIGALAPQAQKVPTIFATDLSSTLASTGPDSQNDVLTERWIREYAKFYNELIDWELDVRSANLDPRCARALTLLRGLCGRSFEPILEIRSKLAAVDFSKDETAKQSIDMDLGRPDVGPILLELERLAKLER